MKDAVRIGLEFEQRIEKILKQCGLEAYRTNKTNPHDPENYKHGFDGGVDIIATFKHELRTYMLYIQCKYHAKGITKTAINEVFGGMYARKAVNSNTVPVVVAHGDASQETRQYARELGVELLLSKEMRILEEASKTKTASYANYGILMKALLFHCTKDVNWVNTMPENTDTTSDISATEELLHLTMQSFNDAQSHLDTINQYQAKIMEEQQKSLNIQRVAVYKVLEASIKIGKQCQNCRQRQKSQAPAPTIDLDSG
jgi:hypothetical protein